jgi:hypothetical protein
VSEALEGKIRDMSAQRLLDVSMQLKQTTQRLLEHGNYQRPFFATDTQKPGN